MFDTVLVIAHSMLFVIVCVGLPVCVILWGMSDSRKRLWVGIKHKIKDILLGGVYSKGRVHMVLEERQVQTLADRYKALKDRREEEAKKALELMKKQQDIMCDIRDKIIAIVKAETGLTLDSSYHFDERYGHRCDFVLNGVQVDGVWIMFERSTTTLDEKTDHVLPYLIETLVKGVRAIQPRAYADPTTFLKGAAQ